MYLDHWDLPAKPFESAPDARFYYRSAAHEGALAQIQYAAENRIGAAMMWGPPGSGKTLILDMVRYGLDPTYFLPVSVSLAAESPEDLLYALLAGLGETELSPQRGKIIVAALLKRVTDWLEAVRSSGRQTVVFIDEAHLMRDRKSLEAVRCLLNPPPGADRAATVILSGQEDLASRVARFTPLDERIEIRAPLGVLSEDEAGAYLLHRVEIAGGRRGIFTRKGARALARAGHFLPGRMNTLAEMCLLTAAAAGLDRVGPDVVSAVLEDMAAQGRGQTGRGSQAGPGTDSTTQAGSEGDI
jgi:general secretion pathway protein A